MCFISYLVDTIRITIVFYSAKNNRQVSAELVSISRKTDFLSLKCQQIV